MRIKVERISGFSTAPPESVLPLDKCASWVRAWAKLWDVGHTVTHVHADGSTVRYTLIPDPVKRRVIRLTINGYFRHDINYERRLINEPVARVYFCDPAIRNVGDAVSFTNPGGAIHRYELIEVDDE